ncbi:MAG: acyl carrier protein [Gemmatimonadota bacterium]
MNQDDVRAGILRALKPIAPEVDPSALKPDMDLREQIDLDSMDVMNFVVAVEKELGVAVPDTDVGGLTTLDEWVAYLSRSLVSEA